jgi:hypothetical protein
VIEATPPSSSTADPLQGHGAGSQITVVFRHPPGSTAPPTQRRADFSIGAPVRVGNDASILNTVLTLRVNDTPQC